MIDKGCKKIAYICGNLNLNLLANRRNDAFIATAHARKVKHVTVETNINVLDVGQYDRLVLELFRKHPDIDGIFAGSDVVAASAIKVCHQQQREIPEEIKIIGYDDSDIASLVTPQLTTIRQPIEEMSELIVNLIHKQINKEEVSTENILPVTLVERETT